MSAMEPILTTLASLPPDAALSPEDSKRGWALFALVALLGILLVACAALLVAMSSRRRRLRQARRQNAPTAIGPDPWEESAKRMPATDETVDLD